MKSRIVSIMLFVVCMGCTWISGAIAQTGYVMVCKGGGDMVGTIRQDYNHGAVNLPDFVDTRFTIVFKASPQAASRQEPAPGTCAWVDRPLSSQEQQHMYLSYWRHKALGVSLINVRHQRYDIPLDASTISDPSFRYLFDAVYNGKLFYVRCSYSQSTHRFEVTSVGP